MSTLTEPTPAADDLERLAAAVDRAAEAIAALDEPARAAVHELQDALEAFHKAALTRVVRRLREDPRGKELLFELVDDPLVYALLVRHGIVRLSPAARAARVIEHIRPYVQSHGGDVELVDVRDATVYVRLHGSCNGCSMSAVTLREGVEEALRANLPEISAVEVVASEPGPSLITLDSIGVRDRMAGWVQGPSVDEVPAGSMRRLPSPQADILIINLDGALSAYRNACAHQGLPLDGGLLDAESGSLTCPWHGFCYDAGSGECLTAPQAQLERFALRVEGGQIWVRPS